MISTSRWKSLLCAALLLGAACDSSSEDGAAATGDAIDGSSGTPGDSSSADTSAGVDAADAAGDAGGGGHPDIVSPQCAIPEGQECNALCHTGCGDGQACLLLSDSWKCVTAGTVAPGAECKGSTDCSKGVCAGGEDEAAVCLAPCKTDSDCPEDGKCNVTVTGSTPFKFCGSAPPPCDAFVAGSCEEGQACYLTSDSMTCLKEGTKQKGEICNGSPNDCAPGTTCINYGVVKGCARLCSMAIGADPSFSCQGLCGAGNFETQDQVTKTGICTKDVEIPTCDPLAQDCTGGAGCYPSEGKWVCMSPGKKEQFEFCGTSNDCRPGLTCQGAGKCYTICDSTMNTNNPKCSSFDVKCNPISGGAGYCAESAGL